MSSTSRANGAAPAPAAARAAPKKWQFVTVNEPKKNQDKDVISIVRAHAMRSVRRKQRLEVTAKYQNKTKAMASQSYPADPGVIPDITSQISIYNGFVDGKGDPDRLLALHGLLTKLETRHLTGQDDAVDMAGSDEQGQRSDYWGGYDKDEIGDYIRLMLGTPCSENPRSLVGDGMFDPFNSMPMPNCDKYDGHIWDHFVSVMSVSCHVDQRKNQNPLTKAWLPYALQDPTLFLATLTFAEVHLEISSGNYNSQRALIHKCHSIGAVNAKLEDRDHALSNETIGAVAMLAAMEGILGNYRELRVHTIGLQRLVHLRGGMRNLGWGGILHSFMSWQNLLSSAMIASTPHDEATPHSRVLRGSLSQADPVFPGLGHLTESRGEIATCFQNMRCLTRRINSWNSTQKALEGTCFSKTRTDTVNRLLSVANAKPATEMRNLDYKIEVCRLAALIYIRAALCLDAPTCAPIHNLKNHIIHLVEQGEAAGIIGVGAIQRPPSITWAFFVTGSLSSNDDEQEWFAQRLAKGVRASGVETWPEMEHCLRQICWLDKLNTATCRSLWSRIMVIHAEHCAARVRHVASEQDQTGDML